jgi:hypothetical protein
MVDRSIIRKLLSDGDSIELSTSIKMAPNKEEDLYEINFSMSIDGEPYSKSYRYKDIFDENIIAILLDSISKEVISRRVKNG